MLIVLVYALAALIMGGELWWWTSHDPKAVRLPERVTAVVIGALFWPLVLFAIVAVAVAASIFGRNES